jgi:hypothetical protein
MKLQLYKILYTQFPLFYGSHVSVMLLLGRGTSLCPLPDGNSPVHLALVNFGQKFLYLRDSVCVCPPPTQNSSCGAKVMAGK